MLDIQLSTTTTTNVESAMTNVAVVGFFWGGVVGGLVLRVFRMGVIFECLCVRDG